jgi:hypothetical protein
LFGISSKTGFTRVWLKNISGYWNGVVGVTAYRYRTLDEELVTNLGYLWAVLDNAQLRVKR